MPRVPRVVKETMKMLEFWQRREARGIAAGARGGRESSAMPFDDDNEDDDNSDDSVQFPPRVDGEGAEVRDHYTGIMQ